MPLMFCNHCQNVMVPEKALKKNMRYTCRACGSEKRMKPTKMVVIEEVRAPSVGAILLKENPELVF